MAQVKFTNLYKLVPEKKKIFSKINSLIKNSKFIGGKEVKLFEKNFANFVGSKNCTSVANGTDALEMAVKSLKIKKGSEIIVPVNTWISTAEAVLASNHKVVFCDVNLEDYSICVDDLKKKISSKTRAVIIVHLYGNPADMRTIKKIVKNKNIKIIEDCAQAHGTKINNKHVGTFGDIGTFSFFPGKNLGAFGDAGAIVTNSKKLDESCRRIRNHGALKKYDHQFPGRNSRLDSLQCFILSTKIQTYEKKIKKRNKLAKIYLNQLKSISEIKVPILDFKKNFNSFHQFVIRVEKKRDNLIKFLNKNKIGTMIHYPYMLNELKFYKKNKGVNSLNNSKKIGKKIISLPISEEHSEREIVYVCNKIKNFYKYK